MRSQACGAGGGARRSRWYRCVYWSLIVVLLVPVPSCVRGQDAEEGKPLGRVGVAYGIPMRCQDGIPRLTVPPRYKSVMGVVALPVARAPGDVLPTVDTGDPDPTLRLFAKADLLVNRRTTGRFEIQVPVSLYDRVAIGWGDEQAPTHSYQGSPCSAYVYPIDTDWLVIPGGVWVAAPECVTLRIELEDGRTDTFQVGVGASC